MILYANTFFQVISLFYISLIGVMFLVKKKLESAENHIFKNLLIVGFLSIILDIASIVCAFKDPNTFVSMLFAKGYLLTIIAFCLLYSVYAIIVTNGKVSNEVKLEQYKKHKSLFFIIFCLIALAIMIAPIYTYVEEPKVMYTYGPATIITYIIVGINIVLWIALLIVRFKKIAPRKTFPIVQVMVLGGISALVQISHPEILLLTAAMIFSIVIMYFSVFTIENPDLEMIEEIKNARNVAVKASQAKTDFLSNMSHELRTPLNAILGFSQGLEEQDLPDEAKEDVEDIINASESLLDLVNEILDISKIESNKFEIINVDYDVRKAYKYLVTMTDGRIGDKEIEFIHKYDENIPPVLNGDCVRIKQVAINLLTNSVKYTKAGYVKLNMTYEPIDSESGYLVITVSDSGIGIKEEDKEKLFSKFSRLDTQKNMNIEGTGLGLALTKKLVDLMEGEIKVESKYGVGSTFTVKLKQNISRVALSDIDDEDDVATGEFTGHGQRILVVDDNKVNLKVVSRLLKKYDVNLDFATSGRECIEKVVNGNNDDYDLIMLDDQMPGMTGKEVIKHLKNISDFHIPTIALTANAISGMKEKYLKIGFDGYLSKPIDRNLLEELLIKFFGKDDKLTTNNAKEKLVNSDEYKEKIGRIMDSIIIEDEDPTDDVDQYKENLKEIMDSIKVENEQERKYKEKLKKVMDNIVVEDEDPTDDVDQYKDQLKKIMDSIVIEEDEQVPEEDEVELLDDYEEEDDDDKKGDINYLKENGIDIDAAIEALGGIDVYNETARDVLDEMDNKMADLEKYLENNDLEDYHIVAHALKSDAKYMGMTNLANSAYNHELAGKEDNIEYIQEHYGELIEETNKMRNVLKKYLGR